LKEERENNCKIIEDVVENLRNLEKIMAYLEQKEDGSLYSLIKSNLGSDIEKLEKVRGSFSDSDVEQ